jgi:hypothetical protein
LLIVALVVRRNFRSQPFQLGLGLRLGEVDGFDLRRVVTCHAYTISTRCLDQPFGRGAGFVGDFCTGQHAGDFLPSAL